MQKHKDLGVIGEKKKWDVPGRQMRQLARWVNEFKHFCNDLIKNFDRMHGCSPPSLLLTSFILELCSVNILWVAAGIKHYFGCTRHFVMHVCVIMVCDMTVQGVQHIFNIVSLRQASPHDVTKVLLRSVTQVLCLSDCECMLCFSRKDGQSSESNLLLKNRAWWQ